MLCRLLLTRCSLSVRLSLCLSVSVSLCLTLSPSVRPSLPPSLSPSCPLSQALEKLEAMACAREQRESDRDKAERERESRMVQRFFSLEEKLDLIIRSSWANGSPSSGESVSTACASWARGSGHSCESSSPWAPSARALSLVRALADGALGPARTRTCPAARARLEARTGTPAAWAGTLAGCLGTQLARDDDRSHSYLNPTPHTLNPQP